MAIARGDWTSALSFHAFGPVLYGIFLITALQISLELITGKSYTLWYHQVPRKVMVLSIIGILFFGYYFLRLYVLHDSHGLLENFLPRTVWQGFVAGAHAL